MTDRRRLVVLVSGEGTNLQALIDACRDPGYGAQVVAVGADRDGINGLTRAERAGLPTFTVRLADHPSREDWDAALARETQRHAPDLVVLAGFMKLVGKAFLDSFGGRCVNTHPALLPSFPGTHGVRDALAHGVKVTGCTVLLVDEGVDAGPIVAQASVPVADDDDEATLHERIKVAERALLVATVGRMLREGWSVQGRKVKVGSDQDPDRSGADQRLRQGRAGGAGVGAARGGRGDRVHRQHGGQDHRRRGAGHAG